MKILIHCLALLLCAPQTSQAQVNKCKQPDGSMIFQDAPCPSGAVSSTVSELPAVTRSEGALSENRGDSGNMNLRRNKSQTLENKLPQDPARDYLKRRAEEEIRESNAKTEAYNRNIRCNNARQQLGVAKLDRPIFHYDNNGDKQYMEDRNRPAAILAAEERVAKECN